MWWIERKINIASFLSDAEARAIMDNVYFNAPGIEWKVTKEREWNDLSVTWNDKAVKCLHMENNTEQTIYNYFTGYIMQAIIRNIARALIEKDEGADE